MTLGQNVTVSVKGKRLVIEVDLGAQGTQSKTGKSTVIASTLGNKPIAEAGVMVGLNVYRAN